jgi:hypothetical protein
MPQAGIGEASMAVRERRLSWRERGHVLGRTAMALCVGWGYLAVVVTLDIGGWGSWMQASLFGVMVKAQVVSVVGITFGAVGAHIGMSNVMAETLKARSAVLAERRAAMRQWRRP